jgi:anti-sigma B factor antagonist
VVDAHGEVDLSTAPALRSRIEQLIAGGARRLVVDLQDVGFLDSSGLSALLASLEVAREVACELVIVCHEERVLKVFTVTGLDEVFDIRGSLDEVTRS